MEVSDWMVLRNSVQSSFLIVGLIANKDMWKSIEIPPTESGIYVVAEFKGDEMVDFSTDYALINEPNEPYYWGPNKFRFSSSLNVTHWMKWRTYKKLLESAPREDNPIK